MFYSFSVKKDNNYTKIDNSLVQKGGGFLAGPVGYFGNGPCGEPCQWNPGESPEDQRQTFANNSKGSYGNCQFSTESSCSIQGYCGTATGTANSFQNEDAFNIPISSSKNFNVKCIDGLATTAGDSKDPYTKTAELVCTTSTNEGRELDFIGLTSSDVNNSCAFGLITGAVSIYPGGYFPFELDSDQTATYGNSDYPATCTGCKVAQVPVWAGCEKSFVDAIVGAFKTFDPCKSSVGRPWEEPVCENVLLFSQPGFKIISDKALGAFGATSDSLLEASSPLSFSVVSGSSAPSINQTFKYTNDEIVVNELLNVAEKFTHSFVYINSDGANTGTYERFGLFLSTGTKVTIFQSEEVDATKTTTFKSSTGQGTNPCCIGDCTVGSVKATTTDTIFAGASFDYTHYFVSTCSIGSYFAYQPTTTKRKHHLAWDQFAYSTSAGGTYSSSKEDNGYTDKCTIYKDKTAVGKPPCKEFWPFPDVKCCWVDDIPGPDVWCWPALCATPINGAVPVGVGTTKAGTMACADIGCGCVSASGPSTSAKEPTTGVVNCNGVISYEECTEVFFSGSPDVSGTRCCYAPLVDYLGQEEMVLEKQGAATIRCAGVNRISYSVAYTHYTSIATNFTERENGGFYMTKIQNDGIYYLGTDGKKKTATSFSISQSKSEITNSDITFAFDTNYFNPMGKTNQNGLDGAKKTFIAMATGPATYLSGSPDGKSAKNNQSISHNGDIHSYYVSDPGASGWNQATWPGHGVVRGNITTGTFKISMNDGAFKNTLKEFSSRAAFAGGLLTVVADGGLNIISSKANTSESSYKTTSSTGAFSTSFDSSFEGDWMARSVGHTFVSTISTYLNTSPQDFPVKQIFCTGCDVSLLDFYNIPHLYNGETSSLFLRGEKSLIFNKNSKSYLWTNPATKIVWGDRHRTYCA